MCLGLLICHNKFLNKEEMDEKDVFRDTWVRYLGYANEVGEAFRVVVPQSVVRLSYGVAFGYVLGDTLDKAYKMHQRDASARRVATAAGDALLWQTCASVVVPGLVINRLCWATSRALAGAAPALPRAARAAATVGVGLAAIPLIVHPIDTAVTHLMDRHVRPYYK